MKKKMQTLKFLNHQLKFVVDLLSGELPIKQARSRNRFLHLLTPRLKELEDERNKIILAKCDKSEDGKPLTEEKDGQKSYKFSNNTWLDVQKELTDLFNENLVIDVTPANEEDIKIVKEIIFNSDKTLAFQETEIYELVAKQFEELA